MCKSIGKSRKIYAQEDVNSNLYKHLRIEEQHYRAALAEIELKKTSIDSPLANSVTDSPSQPNKRKRLDFFGSSENLYDSISRNVRYGKHSVIQTNRSQALTKMLVKTMLPISLVENSAFVEFVNKLDPSFRIPTRHTIKHTHLTKLRETLDIKLRERVRMIEYPNIATDHWTDATQRCFGAFVIQGIASDWTILQFTLSFDHITGKH